MIATVVREVKEETGIDVEVVGLVGIYTDPGHVSAFGDGEVRQEFSLCFRARAVGGRAGQQRGVLRGPLDLGASLISCTLPRAPGGAWPTPWLTSWGLSFGNDPAHAGAEIIRSAGRDGSAAGHEHHRIDGVRDGGKPSCGASWWSARSVCSSALRRRRSWPVA